MKRIIPFIVFIVLGFPAAAEKSETRQMELQSGDTVMIKNPVGSVVVKPGQPGEVQVSALVDDENDEFVFFRRGNRVYAEIVQHQRHRHERGRQSLLTVRMPKDVDLVVESVSANTEIEGLSGKIVVNTTSGETNIRSSATELEVISLSGDINLMGTAKDARILANSMSGNITLESPQADNVVLETVSGDIGILDGSLRRLHVETISGNLEYRTALSPSGNYDFATTNGDVRLVLSGETNASFRVRTFSGRLSNGLENVAGLRTTTDTSRELVFSAGDGSASVQVRTLNGDIRIRSK